MMHGIQNLIGLTLILKRVEFFTKFVDKKDRSAFATVGNINIRISAFQDHRKSSEHGRLTWAM